MARLVTVVEMSTFVRDSHGELGEEELEELKAYVAANPEAGTVIKRTGGVRKLRWAASGKGKRGGGRVIYYFHSEIMPLFLISFFKKSEKSDLSEREKQAMSQLVDALVGQFHPG